MKQWQYCEIDYEAIKTGWFRWEIFFVVKDITPDGSGKVFMRYVAMKPEDGDAPSRYSIAHGAVLSSLDALLLDRAWERLDQQGSHWYSFRYRRKPEYMALGTKYDLEGNYQQPPGPDVFYDF